MNTNQMFMPLYILLVEDNEHDLMAFRRAFQKIDVSCEIDHYSRAESALEHLKTSASSYDLVVSDYKLPGMSGLELFRELRGGNILSPMVILTGSGSERLAVEALKAGVDDYLVKDPEQGYLDLLPVVLQEVVRRHRDQLARLRAEQALKESEEGYRAVVDAFDGLIYICSPDYRIEFMNKRLIERTGYDATGELCYRVLHGLDSKCPWCVNEAVQRGETVRWELKSPRDDHWYYVINTPIFHTDGTISKQAMILDITERKQAEEALKNSERQLKDIINFLPDATFAIDLEGRVTLWNRGAEEFTGMKAADILGKGNQEYAIPFYGVRRPILIDLVLNPSEEIERLYPYVKKEDGMVIGEGYTRSVKHGEAYLMGIAAPLYDSKGNVIGAIESVRDITERKLAEEALRRAHDELEMRVLNRTAELSVINEKLAAEIDERKWAEEELHKSYEQLRKLAAHLQSVREEERTSIAREIHDELGQMLTALKMDISWIRTRLPEDREALIDKTKSDLDLIDETIHMVKKICTELRPAILDSLGLGAAIAWQAGEFQKRTGIKCTFTGDTENIEIDKDRSVALFRIFQETLTNIMRHANATAVEVSLVEEDGRVVLIVRDNGIGIRKDQLSKEKSFGLLGMRERVYPWAGEVAITGIKNKGTKVRVSIPAT